MWIIIIYCLITFSAVKTDSENDQNYYSSSRFNLDHESREQRRPELKPSKITEQIFDSNSNYTYQANNYAKLLSNFHDVHPVYYPYLKLFYSSVLHPKPEDALSAYKELMGLPDIEVENAQDVHDVISKTQSMDGKLARPDVAYKEIVHGVDEKIASSKLRSKILDNAKTGNYELESLDGTCKIAERMLLKNYMSRYDVNMICNMYKNWGDGMKKRNTWIPSRKQRDWFDALSSKLDRFNRVRNYPNVNRGPANDDHRNEFVKATRREYRMLTDVERHRLHRAINILKYTMMDGISMYDIFVQNHQANVAPAAHFGPAFLGYHRELLHRFEMALRDIDPTVSLPYWDSNLDSILGDDLARHSILWSKSFLGNGIGDVVEGPFAYWKLDFPSRTSDSGLLHRNLTMPPSFARTMPALMPDQAIKDMLQVKSMRNISWFVNPMFESHHGAVHNWVGGVMADIPISPADPVFFMHHAFLDCLWEQLRINQKKANIDPRFDYPNDSIALGVGMEQPDGTVFETNEESYHNALNIMRPFAPLLNIDGLSNIYNDKYYSCEQSPVCSNAQPNCGSPYFFCDRNSYRCAPKLQYGSKCEWFHNSGPCYNGECCNGICQKKCDTEDNTEETSQDIVGIIEITNIDKDNSIHDEVFSDNLERYFNRYLDPSLRGSLPKSTHELAMYNQRFERIFSELIKKSD